MAVRFTGLTTTYCTLVILLYNATTRARKRLDAQHSTFNTQQRRYALSRRVFLIARPPLVEQHIFRQNSSFPKPLKVWIHWRVSLRLRTERVRRHKNFIRMSGGRWPSTSSTDCGLPRSMLVQRSTAVTRYSLPAGTLAVVVVLSNTRYSHHCHSLVCFASPLFRTDHTVCRMRAAYTILVSVRSVLLWLTRRSLWLACRSRGKRVRQMSFTDATIAFSGGSARLSLFDASGPCNGCSLVHQQLTTAVAVLWYGSGMRSQRAHRDQQVRPMWSHRGTRTWTRTAFMTVRSLSETWAELVRWGVGPWAAMISMWLLSEVKREQQWTDDELVPWSMKLCSAVHSHHSSFTIHLSDLCALRVFQYDCCFGRIVHLSVFTLFAQLSIAAGRKRSLTSRIWGSHRRSRTPQSSAPRSTPRATWATRRRRCCPPASR